MTLTAFAPVPKAKDTGEKYDDAVVSNGPYKIAEYTKGQQMVLERNANWSAATRHLPSGLPGQDRRQVLGRDPSVIDQRMMADAGEDQTAISRDNLDTASLTTVFNDAALREPSGQRVRPVLRYIAINAKKVPNLKQRQAIAVALDRAPAAHHRRWRVRR